MTQSFAAMLHYEKARESSGSGMCLIRWMATARWSSSRAWSMRYADDGDIFGDGVNIAARLEAIAERF